MFTFQKSLNILDTNNIIHLQKLTDIFISNGNFAVLSMKSGKYLSFYLYYLEQKWISYNIVMYVTGC